MTKSSRKEALKIAGFIGCSGAHQDDKGNWLPCSSAEKLREISTEAESLKNKPVAKSDEAKKKRGTRRRYVKPGYEPLGERGIVGIETLPGGGLVSGKDAKFKEYELIELKADSYTKPKLRESLKRRIMAGSRGGKPGEWSARKAQLLAIEYRRAGGGYRGGKKNPQRSLDKWTREEWSTSDGKPAIRKGGTNRYLPKKAWQTLTPSQREATNRKKRRASQQGRQFVANTERARRAGVEVRNSQKAMIITRARPQKGDPDVYEDPDSARLRSRALGCIGIARRETPEGDYVWTPCTNVSDFRRRTGQSALGQRDEMRRLRRRLRQVGSSAYGKTEKSLYSSDINQKGLSSMINVASVGRRFGNRLGSSLRRNCKSGRAVMRDGDGDGFICNPATGKDDLRLVGGDPQLQELWNGIIEQEKTWAKKYLARHGDKQVPDGGEQKFNRILKNLVNRGFIVTKEKSGAIKIEVPPSFKKQYLAMRALRGQDGVPGQFELGNLGYHYVHGSNDPDAPEKVIGGQLLKLFGYDAVNDVMFSPYFDMPKNVAQVKDGDGGDWRRRWAYAIIDEQDKDILSDNPLGKTLSRKETVEEFRKKVQEFRNSLTIDQKEQRFRDLVDYAKSQGFHDKNKARRIDSDEDTYEAMFKLAESDLGGDEIAEILNLEPDSVRDVFEIGGYPYRQSVILEKIRSDELESIRSDRQKRIRSDNKYRIPKLSTNLDNSRGKQPPTFNEYLEYLKFKAWKEQLFADRDDRSKVTDAPELINPNAYTAKLLRGKEYARLQYLDQQFKDKDNIPSDFQWQFYDQIVKENAADIIQNNNVPEVLQPFIETISKKKPQKNPVGPKIMSGPQDYYTQADFVKLVSILASSNSRKDAETRLKQFGLGELLNNLNRKNGLFPPMQQVLNGLDRRTQAQKPNPGRRLPPPPPRQAVKSIQPITHIIPFSFKVGNSKTTPELSETIIAALAEKVSSHNSQMRSEDKADWSMVTLDKLKTVYKRAVETYEQSGTKKVPSSQSAMDRVNAFLRILKYGQPTNKKYVIDNDLLHDDNPWKKRSVRKKSVFFESDTFTINLQLEEKASLRSISNFASSIGRGGRGLEGRGFRRSKYRRFARFDLRAQDGDGDGMVQDDTNQERPVVVAAESEIKKLFDRLKDPDGGFTFSVNEFDDIKSGWAIARKGTGIKLKVSDVFDESGEIKDDALDSLEALLEVHSEEILKRRRGNERKKLALGGWHNPKDGHIYFDMTDVHDAKYMTKEQAMAEGLRQNQIAIVNLDNLHFAINNDDWESQEIFLDTGGNGNNLIYSPEKQNAQNRGAFLRVLKEKRELSKRRRGEPTTEDLEKKKVRDDRARKKQALILLNGVSGDQDISFDQLSALIKGIGEIHKIREDELQSAFDEGFEEFDEKFGSFKYALEQYVVAAYEPINLYLHFQDSRREKIAQWLKREREDDKEILDLTLQDLGVDDVDNDDEIFEKIAEAVSALSKFDENGITLPSAIKKLYRGKALTSSKSDRYNDLNVGTIFSDKGLVSTSQDPGIAFRFAGVDADRILFRPDNVHVLFEINAPDSVRKKHKVAVGETAEHEWVLPPGAQFQVRRVIESRSTTKDGNPVMFKRIIVDWIGVSKND